MEKAKIYILEMSFNVAPDSRIFHNVCYAYGEDNLVTWEREQRSTESSLKETAWTKEAGWNGIYKNGSSLEMFDDFKTSGRIVSKFMSREEVYNMGIPWLGDY